MKILKYMAFALTGMLMASCGEDFDDWASPQSYPQEDAIKQFPATVLPQQKVLLLT